MHRMRECGEPLRPPHTVAHAGDLLQAWIGTFGHLEAAGQAFVRVG